MVPSSVSMRQVPGAQPSSARTSNDGRSVGASAAWVSPARCVRTASAASGCTTSVSPCPGITSRAAVRPAPPAFVVANEPISLRATCSASAADLLAQRLVLARGPCGQRVDLCGDVVARGGAAFGQALREALGARGVAGGLRARFVRALELEHAVAQLLRLDEQRHFGGAQHAARRGEPQVALALPHQEAHVRLPQSRQHACDQRIAPAGRPSAPASPVRARCRRTRRSGPGSIDASSTDAPAPRSSGSTCSALSMRGLGATLRGNTCVGGSARSACRKACADRGARGVQACAVDPQAQRRRAQHRADLAIEAVSSSSGSASHVGAASSASQSSVATASGARWRSRCAIAAR